MKRSVLPAVALLFCLSIPGCKDKPVPTRDFPPLRPASELKQTDVLPHMEGPITPGRNYVYCGTFQLAWNEMQDKIIKGPIDLEGSPEMATVLNKQPFRQADLSEDCYLAMVGKVEDGIIPKIREAMAERFPSASMTVPDPGPDDKICAYAYMQKSLPFREAFDRFPEPLEFQTGEKTVSVASFGLKYPGSSDRDHVLEKQVTILDYNSDDDFVVQLNSTSTQDEIVLAKVEPGGSLAKTVQAVRQRIKGSKLEDYERSLASDELLIVPVIVIDTERAYSELIGQSILNPGWEEWWIGQARQGIRFCLDETGAQLESDASIPAACEQAMKPRELIFNKPFLLYLKQQGSDVPYFAMWIETPEVLEKAE